MQYSGKTALITGASGGIGEEFACELARRGMHLILVARTQEKLVDLAEKLSTEHGISAQVVVADLSHAYAVTHVVEQVTAAGTSVDILINNAGFGTHGEFVQQKPQREADEISVNVSSLVALTHAYLPGMVERYSGAIINVASTAAFQPVPYMAVYGATKAFVLSFTEALHEENRRHGIRVLALCPGPTATGFFDVAQADLSMLGPKRSSAQVVQTALRALENGQSVVIDGVANNIVAQLPRFFPRSVISRVSAWLMKPKR